MDNKKKYVKNYRWDIFAAEIGNPRNLGSIALQNALIL